MEKGLHVALVQLNPTVGALRANAERIAEEARRVAREGAELIVFPELALSGYPPDDLVLRRDFLGDCEKELQRLAAELPRDVVVIVGAPRPAKGKAVNAAVVFAGGRIAATYRKMLLPNYGVFDEKRVFVPGAKPLVLNLNSARIAVHICEDSWHVQEAPCAGLRGEPLDGVVNLSASPYHRGKGRLREATLGKTARALGTHLLYCNLIGGQDELVFDGASFVCDPRGGVVARAPSFEAAVLRFCLPVASGRRRAMRNGVERVSLRLPNIGKNFSEFSKHWKPYKAPRRDELEEVYAALTLGLRDYVEKNRFPGVVVALSGGIDSSLVAALAVDALGADRVVGVTMPSRFSSVGTRRDAARVARNLGIGLLEIPIQSLFEAFLRQLQKFWPGRPPDVTEENLQARIRGTLIMALSNKFGRLVLSTGNKSELAMGYCTLYGDMVGGFAVLKDVPKTLVFQLARWRNRRAPVIPASVLSRAPSAELRPHQKDTDTLPPYEVLDAILERYIERQKSVAEIVAEGFPRRVVLRVVRQVDRAEYKRRQAPPGIKITPLAFGRERRMPITHHYGELQ